MNDLSKIYSIVEEYEKLNVEASRLGWVQYTTGCDFGIDDCDSRIQQYCMNKENFETIKESMKLDWNEDDRRRLELVYKVFEPFHLSDELNDLNLVIMNKVNELSKILNTHRAVFEGREISSPEILHILCTEDDRERRKAAFLARCSVNKALVEGGFVELLKLRNKYARLAGKKDFVEYKLEESELDASLFDSWKTDLHSMLPKIKERRTEFARKYLNDDEIMPWDEAYINGKIAPALNMKIDMSQYYAVIRDFMSRFGIDITKFNITYDIFPRAHKSEWGYNFTIEHGKDSRILANVKSLFNEYRVLLHETGHAVHSFCTDPKDLLMNLGISGIISEGIANLFGGMIFEQEFYSTLLPDTEDVRTQFKDLREYQALTAMLSIHNILFDQALYRTDINSLEDINNLYWAKSKELFHEEPYAAEPAWGFRIHYTTHPIYLHNYFMGDVTCEMLAKAFQKQYGVQRVLDKPLEFGQYLIDNVIKVSGRYKYQELYRRISDEDFSLKALMEV